MFCILERKKCKLKEDKKMTLIKWKPTTYTPVFSDFWNNFYKDFSQVAGSEGSFSAPAVNISENAQGYELEIAAPGLTREDFNLSLEKNLLTISANKEDKEEDNTAKVVRREFSYYSFKRSFELPDLTDGDRISASYENGVLKVSIPKKEEAKDKEPRKIEIQ